MPCRCGMVKLMRLDVKEPFVSKQKSGRILLIEQKLFKERIRRLTKSKK